MKVWDQVRALFQMPNLAGFFQVSRDLTAFTRVHFFYAAAETGLWAALPASRAELARRLPAARPELLEGLLDLGLGLGELAEVGGQLRVKGERGRALSGAAGDPLLAMVQEHVIYHASVYRHLGERLHGAPLGDYLAPTGNVVARSSRVLEPFMAGFIRSIVPAAGPARLLEVGCGSGIYLRHAAERNPDLTGVALELQPEVAEQARANLAGWGLAARFAVRTANILQPPDDLGGGFDLITLYNNIYYFPVAARVNLLRALRARLAPGGQLALVSVFRGPDALAVNFDLVLRSTLGCAPLPELNELSAQLRTSGFARQRSIRLAPGSPLFGLLAG